MLVTERAVRTGPIAPRDASAHANHFAPIRASARAISRFDPLSARGCEKKFFSPGKAAMASRAHPRRCKSLRARVRHALAGGARDCAETLVPCVFLCLVKQCAAPLKSCRVETARATNYAVPL
ncbi:MAG TPA: hypothetical protein VK438_03410 [Xanthobacteraceae bacterium]|nr:hypothetical protein [Xanthobacteraceae bacterium]